MRKIIASCTIGNALEWYDFVIYGYFAVIIGKLFFPESDSAVQLLATWGIFWVGFLSRPLGAILFGHIGDRVSRKTALTTSIYVMAVPTALIGCLPTYDIIGIWGAVLLLVLRFFQGIAIGGEFTGSMIFLIEHAAQKKKGFAGSFASASLIMGVIVGSAISTLVMFSMSKEALESYGWRIPFLLSVVGSFIGAYMRKNLSDPKGFNAELDKASHSFPLRELFLNHKSKMLLVIFIDFLTAIGFFILVVFLVNYLKVFLKIPNYIALSINTFNMIVFMLFTFLGGALSDKFGRKVMITMPSVFFILASYPIFILFQTGVMGAFLAQLIIAIAMGLFFGAIPATISEQFPVSVRFSGLSLSHNISMAIFGGSAPLIATHIIESTGDLSSPAWLLVIGAVLTLIGAHYLPSRTKYNKSEEPLLAEYRN